MVFGPALSLGIASLSEYVDLRLDGDRPVEIDGLVGRLNDVSELGLRFLHAAWLGDGDKRITRLIDEGVYVAGVPHFALADLGLDDVGALAARIAERRRGDLTVLRTIKGIGKKVDVGRYLLDVEAGAGQDVLEAAGLGGHLTPIRIRLRITGGGTAKVSEALRVLPRRRRGAAGALRARGADDHRRRRAPAAARRGEAPATPTPRQGGRPAAGGVGWSR
jgi:hypothetical protein